jgi:hypothetical protein
MHHLSDKICHQGNIIAVSGCDFLGVVKSWFYDEQNETSVVRKNDKEGQPVPRMTLQTVN